MTYNTFSFKVTKTSMWFVKIGSFFTYFTRIPPPPLLLRLGYAPWVVSPELDLFKWCQKKRITKGYHLKLYFLSQDASQVSEKPKQRCPSRSHFGADCSGISGSPCYHCNSGFIFPAQLKYRMPLLICQNLTEYILWWFSDLRQNWPLPFLICQNLTE